jgi:hypothetical protein
MKPDQRGLSIGIVTLLLAVFLVDTHMGLGFTPWLLYVIPLGLTYWALQYSAPLIVAALASILTGVAYFLSPPLVPQYIALTNRAMGIVMFWMLASLVAVYQLLARRLTRVAVELRRDLMERTQDLGRAVNALRSASDQGIHPAPHSPVTTQLKRQVADVLLMESRRLHEQAGQLMQDRPAPLKDEDALDETRQELERLNRQLEQLQRELLRH